MSGNGEVKLSMEQEFLIAKFDMAVDKLTLEQARKLLCEMNRAMIVQQVTYVELMRKGWGL